LSAGLFIRAVSNIRRDRWCAGGAKYPAELPTEAAVHDGMKPESQGSKNTFPKRTKRPGEAGLANEARPGLGSRGRLDQTAGDKKSSNTPHDTEPQGRNAVLPPRQPREQPSDSLAHELERDTGVSGQSSGT
jgi:hypothetical protein